MCGIAGYVRAAASALSLQPLVHGLRVLGHRGPDDEGLTVIDRAGRDRLDFITDASAAGVELRPLDRSARPVHDIAFGHRRFSIVDLSTKGHQPMWTLDGRVCVCVNGEIYNHVALREELAGLGWEFASTSDSEVLAVAYRQWGTDCFARFNGFWALSLYDADRNQVLLARDRLGKAPLYYAVSGRDVYWASEIGVVRSLCPTECTVRDQSVVDFMRWHRKDIGHSTFFNEIETLDNACYAWIGDGGSLDVTRYWELPTERMTVDDVSIDEAATELKRLLTDAIRLRLRADVPASVQVSGGMDSSSILAIAAEESTDVSAFTVRFPGSEVDEEPYARMVAERFPETVTYNVFEPPDTDLLDAADSFIGLMGEPFHSPNLYTANSIWQVIASEGFRVNLYGSGGDEMLAGYSQQTFYPYIRRLLGQGRIGQARRELVALTDREPGRFGSDYLLRAARCLPYGERMSRMLKEHRARRHDDAFVPPPGVRPGPGPAEAINPRMIDLATDQLLSYWLRIDSQSSMSVPLELRNPFLDYRVAEFAFSLPLEYLMRDGWMKWMLRRTMHDDLPPEVTWRRVKAGFPFPLADWLVQHEKRLLSMLADLDCPYVDNRVLASSWPTMAERDPTRLWCVVSVGLWWKKTVAGDSLELSAS